MKQNISISSTHLDAAHPNFSRWKRAADSAVQRGELVCDILESAISLRGKQVLDAGCGLGGSSIALARRGASVTAIDRDSERLAVLRREAPGVTVLEADLFTLPAPDSSFDAIVLQDVIEHVQNPQAVLSELSRVLRDDGVLYLSTPNRSSIANIAADPHFGLPFVSLKKREDLRRILRRRRPQDADRDDLAELFSEDALHALLLAAGFTLRYVNRRVAAELLHRPEALVWSTMHLRIVKVLRSLGILRFAISMVRDTPGLFNRWVNPTWYLLCRKDDA